MQIYFTTRSASARNRKEVIKKIIDYLKKDNSVTLRSKIIEDKDIFENVGLDLIPLSKAKDGDILEKVFKDNQKKILNSDVVICEMSEGSAGTGYDIAQALINNKPVLVLCDRINGLSEVISGNKSNRLMVKYYNDDNILSIIDDFLHSSKKLLDSKFILIIPPEIERYLSWSSNKKGVRKAEIVRAAIDKYMEHDVEYKKYVNELEK